MQASDYLRTRFQSDRHLAMSAQNGYNSIIQSAKGVASDIYSGVERASWYTSCLIPKYHNVCDELVAEETRTLYSISSIYKYRDVLQHMLYLYFEKVTDDIYHGNHNGRVRHLDKVAANIASHTSVAKGTRYAIAESISQAMAHSGFLSETVANSLSGKASFATAALQFFGIEQKAVMAARRLKAIDPEYYWVLYNAKLEMLYYFVEPVLDDIIKKVKMGTFSNLEELSDAVRERFNV